jgi:alkylation response protein AidB-like acyl-CoA dehydrogenase
VLRTLLSGRDLEVSLCYMLDSPIAAVPDIHLRALSVHYGLFLGAVRGGATQAQFNYWVEKGVLGLNGVIGCFGMTELAHG